MLEINSQTIPAWVVAANMVLTGIMWLIVLLRKSKLRMDVRGIAITFILQGLVYGVVYQFGDLSAEVRGFFSRLMLLLLAWSQLFPLIKAYLRSE